MNDIIANVRNKFVVFLFLFNLFFILVLLKFFFLYIKVVLCENLENHTKE